MLGQYYIKVSNKRVSFEIKIKRSVTIIRGYSGTGKSTFINMLESALTETVTGITLNTDYDRNKIEVIRNSRQIEYVIRSAEKNKIFVMDENVDLEKYIYFVEYLKTSGSYLVYITRKNRTGLLQFSVDEIYTFNSKTNNNYTTVNMYPKYPDVDMVVVPDIIVTEDSNSGHDIIEHIVNIPVESSDGKDNVANMINDIRDKGYSSVYVIVDCAAFGNCIEKVLALGAHVCRIESFEYMMLNTYVFGKFLNNELTETYLYAESSCYYTWEQYYTALLQELCKKFPNCSYRKDTWNRLNAMFKADRFLDDIAGQLKDLDESVKTVQ
ncbi:MAG: AAA family ATPase [Lachnospiraceae bacterium]|nr:AAA family ATPase [Lachnospiraceae bacterium]